MEENLGGHYECKGVWRGEGVLRNKKENKRKNIDS